MTSINQPSICIPRVSNNIKKDFILTTFEQIFGKDSIQRVDIVKKQSNDYSCVFVHFNFWMNTPNVQSIRNRLLNNNSFKIVYNDPWFWKCSASRLPKPKFVTNSDNNSYQSISNYNNQDNNQISYSPPPIRRQSKIVPLQLCI